MPAIDGKMRLANATNAEELSHILPQDTAKQIEEQSFESFKKEAQ